ncbi:MAG: C40 family peptidase, partial [Actinomycetota bacterium]|nr:C40 family peptidase [Actinomycetota bacterium]
PPAVQAAINAGNAIRSYPYRFGGGHRSFYDTGYDCSGAVSYVLNAAGLLASPVPSGSLMSWGEPGKGWITVFANKGHAYATIAGLRWDTSAVGEPLNRGTGPRWRATKRKPKGYTIRHVSGY